MFTIETLEILAAVFIVW